MLTLPGIVNYVIWNVVVLALSILVIFSLRQREKDTANLNLEPVVRAALPQRDTL